MLQCEENFTIIAPTLTEFYRISQLKHAPMRNPTPKSIQTREQVKQQFDRIGMSVAEWSRIHEVSQSLTYQVLNGNKKGNRGQAHRIAVLLGIKDGIA